MGPFISEDMMTAAEVLTDPKTKGAVLILLSLVTAKTCKSSTDKGKSALEECVCVNVFLIMYN